MKKKNLIILLIFPFLISVFCIATINSTYNMIDVDISYIDWDYGDMVGFKIGDEPEKLVAVGVNQRHYKAADSDKLIWTVKNKDGSEEPHAEIYIDKGQYYIRALTEGDVVITCSNVKGNVQRSLDAVIYENAAILFSTGGASQTRIDPTVYYGQYDHERGRAAEFTIGITVLPEELSDRITYSCSDNVTFDLDSGRVNITGVGDAYVTVTSTDGMAAPRTYSFTIVEGGVNVYNYDDLINCTKKSKYGEIVVLRKNFESIENTYLTDGSGRPIVSFGEPVRRNEDTVLFGRYENYNAAENVLLFDEEDLYHFRTTYITTFIEQWNAFVDTDSRYSKITDHVYAGLVVRKDFYGNGYTINLHELTYPSKTAEAGDSIIPVLGENDRFRGPLKMYTLGDPNNSPLVSLYGQDNVGMYVEGNEITVNDVNVKNCDFGDRIANLDTVGTVLEVCGDGVVIKNSRISNGKNVVRSFSSNDLLIDNCILSNARNFLFLTGSNQYVPVDRNALSTFENLDGETRNEAIRAFFKEGAEGDEILNTFIVDYCDTTEEKKAMRAALESIQSAFDKAGDGGLPVKGSTEIRDTYFYRSGISAICLETLFNSPFLETASPSLVSSIFEELDSLLGGGDKELVPYIATHVSGVSYPVEVTVTGKTRFYDYKAADKIELDGLIEENLTEKAAGLYDGEIGVDTVFPLRTMIMQKARSSRFVCSDGESNSEYVNVPVAFYGGGINLSRIAFRLDDGENYMSSSMEIDLLDSYLGLKGSSADPLAKIKGIVFKTVPTVTGYEPFKFNFIKEGYLFGETPNIQDLKDNAKENNSLNEN